MTCFRNSLLDALKIEDPDKRRKIGEEYYDTGKKDRNHDYWYKIAALLGHKDAQFELAKKYYCGNEDHGL